MNAGRRRCHRFEFAAHFNRRLRLHVPQINMARTAEEKNKHAGVLPMLGQRRIVGGPRPQRRKLLHAQTHQAQTAQLQQFTPGF